MTDERKTRRLQASIARANDQARAARDRGWTSLAEQFERLAVALSVRLASLRVG
ncbi:hypothetical protein [Phreatobacter sp.]|uniref:hypothetical protein n=1 Tax=Phreatobacter sp. TaxID=1966341 RepID=UPI003F722FF7